ncbi:hypothetical protein LOK49_LG03G01260 [Camellia lanceoleosa]|uniref:Uncharacterized protein n=1 Tax=Camellia lanceoleosa TaxID=1840588 RepID=A0ACC0IB57_9ERIC|nr:hypothetical protein LOK49_LG03G01260 [Camellia lanceoleosa]
MQASSRSSEAVSQPETSPSHIAASRIALSLCDFSPGASEQLSTPPRRIVTLRDSHEAISTLHNCSRKPHSSHYFGYFFVICSIWQFEFRSSSPASVQPPQFAALVCSLDESVLITIVLDHL